MPRSQSLRPHLAYYRSQHRTIGCRLTHLFGIPLIAMSVPMLLFDRKKAVMLFTFGWFLQFLGHFAFEHNKPILFTKGRSPYTLLSALVFVAEEWVDTIRSVSADLRIANHNGKH